MTPVPIKPEIAPDLLDKIDIRVGTILSVADMPGADKLVCSRIKGTQYLIHASYSAIFDSWN